MPFLPPNQQHQNTEGIIETKPNATKADMHKKILMTFHHKMNIKTKKSGLVNLCDFQF